jgi:AmmeMemoRadiSam system protein B
MRDIRPAAVAGQFYPGSPAALSGELGTFLGAVAGADAGTTVPKALVVPHAGYVYSGGVAATAYARLAAGRDTIRRVVLLGPTHHVALRGLALPAAGAFATPLGVVEVDTEAAALLRDLPQVTRSAAAHAQEHSLEVQLPFLQRTLAQFKLVPLAVGMASADDVAAVLDRLWGGPETLIVISTDLSHYHGYVQAQRIDRSTAQRILALTPTLDHDEACGATPLNGFLVCARRRGLIPELLDLRNSGDTAGDRSRVVGYAAFAFEESCAGEAPTASPPGPP